MPSFIIDTEREPVYLKQLTLQDAPAYYEAVDASREHLSQFDEPTSDNYPDLASVKESIINPRDPSRFRMGIWDGPTFVGSINITPKEGDTAAEIGYWLDVRHTGKGYATLATKAMSTYFRGKYPRIYAEVVEDNEPSAKVLERSGFHLAAKRAGRLLFELGE